MMRLVGLVLVSGIVTGSVLFATPPDPRTPKEALQAFGDLIGTWRGTGTPTAAPGAKAEFWTETIAWEWKFKGDDAWLKCTFEKSKNFTGGELHYLPEKDEYSLILRTPAKETLTFTGTFKDKDTGKVLTVEREENGEVQRFVFTFLHPERYLYKYEVRPAGKALFSKKYQVGATKEGVAFATGDGKPECIVSGGLGTIPVSYMGKTYYVCCSGCRDEFNASPAKYVKEFEEKQAKAKKK